MSDLPSQSAINGLILTYLEDTHPTCVAAMSKVKPAPSKSAAHSAFGNKTLQSWISTLVADECDEPPKKKLQTEVAKKSPVADSDSDDEPVKAPVKPAAPAAKKAPVADSDSDDEPVKAPVKPAAPAAKKAPVADS
eukprot:CAMPEP_0176438924 /NCGR_PEP_ID=MMETSP0127-20121128/19607_1 /TAXON_ID=938130 /ORGANISM="Platyophrya macrostoma, Strain WH" /LENGTH=135 /DNA_ID=CAMNT_0017823035 /DNA_START=37 /DNA_END=440 /DNA_ORIENTATION=-